MKVYYNYNHDLEDMQIGDIFVLVAVCCEGSYTIIEQFDCMKEAKKYVREERLTGCEYWYLAAEVINKDGDLNPACWGKTQKEAVDKLKKVL